MSIAWEALVAAGKSGSANWRGKGKLVLRNSIQSFFLCNLAKIKARKDRRFQRQRVKDVDSRENDILQANFASFDRSKLDRRLLLFLADKFEMSE